MPDKEPDSDAPQLEIEEQTDIPRVVISETFESIYANAVNILSSGWDLRLVFGEVGPDKDGKLVNKQKLGVVMSFEHAKALWQLIGKQLRQREDKYGQIYITPTAKV